MKMCHPLGRIQLYIVPFALPGVTRLVEQIFYDAWLAGVQAELQERHARAVLHAVRIGVRDNKYPRIPVGSSRIELIHPVRGRRLAEPQERAIVDLVERQRAVELQCSMFAPDSVDARQRAVESARLIRCAGESYFSCRAFSEPGLTATFSQSSKPLQMP